MSESIAIRILTSVEFTSAEHISSGMGAPGEPMFPTVVGGGDGGVGEPPGLPMFPPQEGTASTRVRRVAARVDFTFISVSQIWVSV
jgi:hypothetical protein